MLGPLFSNTVPVVVVKIIHLKEFLEQICEVWFLAVSHFGQRLLDHYTFRPEMYVLDKFGPKTLRSKTFELKDFFFSFPKKM